MSLHATRGYDPSLAEEIARLCVQMGDWAEAGRWYFICDSTDEHAADAIARFERTFGPATGREEQLARRLPLHGKIPKFDGVPERVRERLRRSRRGQYYLDRFAGKDVSEPINEAVKSSETAWGVGCVAVMLGFAALVIIGAITVISWLVKG